MVEIPFEIGEKVSNARLMGVFQCGVRGGIRPSNTTNTIVLITGSVRGPYKDRWEGNLLYFTGAGQTGDQSLDDWRNRRVANSGETDEPLYLFEQSKAGAYTYRSSAELVGKPYQEQQTDSKGNLRNVWMFPIKVVVPNADVITEKELTELQNSERNKASKLPYDELLKRAAAARGRPSERRVVTTQYIRNEAVIRAAKKRANGKCLLCSGEAPFLDKKGEPFLETHHIEWLSEGGTDTLDNTVALCPNCHRKIHALNLEDDVVRLKTVVSGNG